MNHQTLFVIAGGRINPFGLPTNKIYYAMSKDICNDSIDNIWQISKVSLSIALSLCKCMITHESTMNPKFIVLGGENPLRRATYTYAEYNLYDITGNDTFKRFMLDFLKVMFDFSHIVFLNIKI